MKTQKTTTKRQWVLTLPFLCVFTFLLLGGWLLSAGEEAIPSVSKVVIDDFSRETKDTKGNLRWTLVIGQTGNIQLAMSNSHRMQEGLFCILRNLSPQDVIGTL
jgi:hypothetical protein